ncbi:MAG: hypothetical protein LUD46_13880 [Parabacteroides sp.]|nr:hypothetical protein [Parabacteroides sp.]
MYRTTGSNARVRITCPDGCGIESQPDWLDIAEASVNGAEIIYSLTLNDRDVTGVPDDKGTVTFYNKKNKLPENGHHCTIAGCRAQTGFLANHRRQRFHRCDRG